MKRRRLTILGVTVVVLGLLVLINFIPTFNLKTKAMSKLEGEWINLYYEQEEATAKDLLNFADEATAEIAKRLGFNDKQDVNVYVYDSQHTMQQKKYGYVVSLLSLDWYIGDNLGRNVILTSPSNPGDVHEYDDVKDALPHEIVHAYISVINPKPSLWLTEGMALHLSNGEAFHRDLLSFVPIPSFEDTGTKNPIHFSNMGGYTFAHTYIEYLENHYSWDSVLKLIGSEDYEGTLGRTRQEIYDEWVNYLESYPT